MAIGTGIASCACTTALPYLRSPGKVDLQISSHISISHEAIIFYGVPILGLLATQACKNKKDSLSKGDCFMMGSAILVGSLAGLFGGTALTMLYRCIRWLKYVERHITVPTNPIYLYR